jgi:hypothetical protein
MVRKLGTLISILLLSLTTFSQVDTNKICLSYKIAKLIAIDLVKGDSAKAELSKTQELLTQLQIKINEQDTVIGTHVKKEINYKKQIELNSKKEIEYKDIVVNLEKDNIKLTTKNENLRTTTKVLGGGFVTILVAFITVILIK